jgi:hypothetical protein
MTASVDKSTGITLHPHDMIFTRNSTSNTSRWATNADSRTARRDGDARNSHGHGQARISAHDALARYIHERQRAS